MFFSTSISQYWLLIWNLAYGRRQERLSSSKNENSIAREIGYNGVGSMVLSHRSHLSASRREGSVSLARWLAAGELTEEKEPTGRREQASVHERKERRNGERYATAEVKMRESGGGGW